jgi:vacuolar protein sorting-associated protein 13D
LCELKIYTIGSSITINKLRDVHFTLSLHNMLLIDARQIYGADYQLLAASHSNLVLDPHTGVIINSVTGLREDLTKSNAQNQEPLINIDLTKTTSGGGELVCDTVFSNLDLILNPETLSEIVLLAYSVYFNLSKENTLTTPQIKRSPESTCESNAMIMTKSMNETELNEQNAATFKINSKVNFKFNRLSVLMFRIEDEDLGVARKVALFALDGVSIKANIIPALDYFEIVSKLDDLNISDLCSTAKTSKTRTNIIFGIGLEQQQQQNQSVMPNIFELVYRKSKHEITGDEINELKVKIASLFYIHTPRLVYDIEHCLKDFKRFHARIMEDVADKAANLALEMLKKGQTYLTKTLAELYQQDEEHNGEEKRKSWLLNDLSGTSNSGAASAQVKDKVVLYKIKFLLETPVIAIPIDAKDFSSYFVAHLGQIQVKNVTAGEEPNQRQAIKHTSRPHDTTNFHIKLSNMSMFSIETKQELDELAKKSITVSNTKANFFQIFYKPCKHQSLIDKTTMDMSVSYLPNFKNETVLYKQGKLQFI